MRKQAESLWAVPPPCRDSDLLVARELQAIYQGLMDRAVAKGTRDAYTRVWTEILQFVQVDLGLPWSLPLSNDVIALFISKCHS